MLIHLLIPFILLKLLIFFGYSINSPSSVDPLVDFINSISTFNPLVNSMILTSTLNFTETHSELIYQL